MSFRHSLLLHLRSEDLTDEVRAPLVPLSDGLLTPSSQAGAEDLVRCIRREVEGLHERTRQTWRARVRGAAGEIANLDLVTDALHLDASVSLPPLAQTPTIRLSLGTVLALDDLILTALNLASVLLPSQDALRHDPAAESFVLPAPLLTCGAQEMREGRFVEYHGALEGGVQHSILTYAMPAAPWRLLQASLISELALAWVLFHERAHWALGHLDLFRQIDTVGGAGEMKLDETPEAEVTGRGGRRRKRNSASRRILEGQADSLAFLLLCDYAMRSGGAADRYGESAPVFGVPDDPRVIRSMTLGVCLHLCITAVSLACLAFHEARRGAAPSKRGTHPDPAGRLLAMVSDALVIAPMARQNDAGRWGMAPEDRTGPDGNDTPEFHDFTYRGVVMGLWDLQQISVLLDADFSSLQRNEGRWSAADWLRDLLGFWVTEGSEREPCVTAAGREIERLRRIDPLLQPRLDALQEQRFGSQVWLRAGGFWQAPGGAG